jgi:hypothetical protein
MVQNLVSNCSITGSMELAGQISDISLPSSESISQGSQLSCCIISPFALELQKLLVSLVVLFCPAQCVLHSPRQL